MTETASLNEKTLKVPTATHAKLSRLCRALDILDFADERTYKRVSIGEAIERLLAQDWAKDILARAKSAEKPKL